MGGVAIDQTRGWWADLNVYGWAWRPYSTAGAVTLAEKTPNGAGPAVDTQNIYEGYHLAKLRPEMQIPIGAVNRPRSLAILACAWMGEPAL